MQTWDEIVLRYFRHFPGLLSVVVCLSDREVLVYRDIMVRVYGGN